jgi:hypothetical protein
LRRLELARAVLDQIERSDFRETGQQFPAHDVRVWVLAMLQAASVAETSVGIGCGVLSLALGSIPFAEAAVPGVAGSLISAGPLGIAFGVVYWLLMIYVPQVKSERAEERKSWTDERAAIFARHQVEIEREREDCVSSTKRLIERVEQLELKLDHIGEKVVQK